MWSYATSSSVTVMSDVMFVRLMLSAGSVTVWFAPPSGEILQLLMMYLPVSFRFATDFVTVSSAVMIFVCSIATSAPVTFQSTVCR